MVKTYDICVTMNLNKKYVLKLLPVFLVNTSLHVCWNSGELLLYARPVATRHSEEVFLNFFVPPKFCCAGKSSFWTYTAIKSKILPPWQFILPFQPQNLAAGLLYANLDF